MSQEVTRRFRWREWAALVVLTPIVSVAAYHLGQVVAGPGPGRPVTVPGHSVRGLGVDPRYLDLGEVWETPDHVVKVPVRNRSGSPLTVTAFSTSCDCSAVEPSPVTVPAGGSTELTVRVNLTHRLPYQRGLAEWPARIRIDPVFGGDFAPTPGWELTATVRSRVSLDTTRLSFLDMCTHGGEPVTRKIRATAHVPVQRLEATAEPAVALVRAVPVPDAPGRYDVTVAPTPDLPVGPFRFEVRVTAVAPGGQTHPCATIPVDGEMQPPTQVVPSTLLLGEHPVPGQAEAEIVVRLVAKNWAVSHVETDAAEVTVDKVGVEPNGRLRYRVTQRLNRPGDHKTQVRFVIRRPDGKTEPTVVTVIAYGIPSTPERESR